MNFNKTYGYNTVYEYRILGKPNWIKPTSTSCFSGFFSSCGPYLNAKGYEFKIQMYYPEDELINQYQPNCCFLNEEELNLLLQEFQQWLDFDYTITIVDKTIDCEFILRENNTTAKVFLSLIRLCYENSYNVCMKEVFNLRKLSIYPNLSILYTYFLVQQSVLSMYINTGHCFFSVSY